MNTYEPLDRRRRAAFALASTAASVAVFAALLALFERASRQEEPALARAPATAPAPARMPATAPAPALAAPGSHAAPAPIVAAAACAAGEALQGCAPPLGANP